MSPTSGPSNRPVCVAARPGSQRRRLLSRLSSLLVVALFLNSSGCARNPVSGWPEAVLTSEKAEIDQGNEAARQVELEIGLVENPALQAYLAQLGQRLAKHSPRTRILYHFKVANMPEANAFALPGGHIYVSRGLLALVNSEDELAAILGHEIGHVAARHSVRRQAASAPLVPLRIAAALGGAAASIVSPGLGQLVAGIGQLPGAFALAAYSRDQEREADRLGQQLAAEAGFDPMALSHFTHTIAREEALDGRSAGSRSFLVSHPPSPERSASAKAYARELKIAVHLPAPLDREDFLRYFDGIVLGQPALGGVFVDERFLHPELGVGFALPLNWETLNSPSSVSAQNPEGTAHLVVEIVGEGQTALEAAHEFGGQVRLDARPRSSRIHGLEAAHASAVVRSRPENNQLILTWVAHDNLVYRIVGIAPISKIANFRPGFTSTAQSFHALSPAEQAEIFEDRLRLVQATKGETLEMLGKRSGNEWSVARTALANGVDENVPLVPGGWIKTARLEPYSEPIRASP
jgi:predicted Zn-dependent protease